MVEHHTTTTSSTPVTVTMTTTNDHADPRVRGSVGGTTYNMMTIIPVWEEEGEGPLQEVHGIFVRAAQTTPPLPRNLERIEQHLADSHLWTRRDELLHIADPRGVYYERMGMLPLLVRKSNYILDLAQQEGGDHHTDNNNNGDQNVHYVRVGYVPVILNVRDYFCARMTILPRLPWDGADHNAITWFDRLLCGKTLGEKPRPAPLPPHRLTSRSATRQDGPDYPLFKINNMMHRRVDVVARVTCPETVHLCAAVCHGDLDSARRILSDAVRTGDMAGLTRVINAYGAMVVRLSWAQEGEELRNNDSCTLFGTPMMFALLYERREMLSVLYAANAKMLPDVVESRLRRSYVVPFFMADAESATDMHLVGHVVRDQWVRETWDRYERHEPPPSVPLENSYLVDVEHDLRNMPDNFRKSMRSLLLSLHRLNIHIPDGVMRKILEHSYAALVFDITHPQDVQMATWRREWTR